MNDPSRFWLYTCVLLLCICYFYSYASVSFSVISASSPTAHLLIPMTLSTTPRSLPHSTRTSRTLLESPLNIMKGCSIKTSSSSTALSPLSMTFVGKPTTCLATVRAKDSVDFSRSSPPGPWMMEAMGFSASALVTERTTIPPTLPSLSVRPPWA